MPSEEVHLEPQQLGVGRKPSSHRRRSRVDPGAMGLTPHSGSSHGEDVLTVGSLFAGIGGFDLGFERAGMRTLWQVEQSEFCRRVLERHFPGARRYEDVRHVGAAELQPVDLICGGFPCQDLSYAGKGAGLEGERSGLWSEYARIVRELRPRYVVVENVSALLARGLGRVLADLAACGYDAEWDCIPASAVGAPHRRDRLWLVAYPRGVEHQGSGDADRRSAAKGLSEAVADAQGHPLGAGLCADEPRGLGWGRPSDIGGTGNPWATEPDVGRVAHGIPARVDRLAALGNALVPQIAEWIGRRIIEAEGGVAA